MIHDVHVSDQLFLKQGYTSVNERITGSTSTYFALSTLRTGTSCTSSINRLDVGVDILSECKMSHVKELLNNKNPFLMK